MIPLQHDMPLAKVQALAVIIAVTCQCFPGSLKVNVHVHTCFVYAAFQYKTASDASLPLTLAISISKKEISLFLKTYETTQMISIYKHIYLLPEVLLEQSVKVNYSDSFAVHLE